jgi:acetylornithine deacetylase/succinyl-diaminopimelate desuccinylase-like protein
MSRSIQQFVDERWDTSIVPTLCDYIRIPNKSPMFDPDWEANGHMQEAVALLDAWCDSIDIAGMTREVVALPGRTPVLICEIPATAGSPDVGTVLLYGHYDKQPEFLGWEPGLSPWEPVLRDGRLYGRGGADDGYALFGSLTAIAALEAQGIEHGRCVVLIEGCEESGSFDLPFYMEALSERIGSPDLVICLDAECGNYEQLWITTSLRGIVPGALTVKVLEEGQHSGMSGGIVPSSFRILRQLMNRVENPETGDLLPSLYVEIPDAARSQAEKAAQVLGTAVIEKFPWAGNTRPLLEDPAELLLNNTWRPSLATTGLSGAPEVGNAGNTLRPETSAQLSFRLPPTLDAEAALNEIRSELERDPPFDAIVSFDTHTAQAGWAAPPVAAWLEKAMNDASQSYFKRPVMYMGCGGTIPFMKMLGDAYPGVQFMVTGVLGPNSNAHGPNEFLEIGTGKRITACVADVLADHARRPVSG